MASLCLPPKPSILSRHQDIEHLATLVEHLVTDHRQLGWIFLDQRSTFPQGKDNLKKAVEL